MNLGPQPTGTDDSDSLNGWFASLPAGARASLYPTRYKIRKPLLWLDKVACLDFSGSVLDWYGVGGAALTVGFSPGNPAAGQLAGSGWTLRNVAVHHTGRGEGYYQNGSTAFRMLNIRDAVVDGLDADGFGTGLHLRGDATGCVYNRVEVRQLANCFTSMLAESLNGGFVAEINVRGGNWQYGPVAQGTTPTHFSVAGQGAGSTRFLDCSFQGWPGVTWATLFNSQRVVWRDCRFETTDLSNAPINLGANTQYCALLGSTTPCVAWNDASGGTRGHVFKPNWV